MRTVKATIFVVVVTALTVAASAPVSAPQVPRVPPPDEPAIYISSEFVQDDGAVKVVKDVTVDVAGMSITGATGRIRGTSQITLQNATITISPAVATHVRSQMTYTNGAFRPQP